MQLAIAQINRASLERSIASQQQDASFAVRYANAAATVSGSPQQKTDAALAAFDAQAQAEQQSLYLSLTATYGNAYAQTQEYGDKMTSLQKAQGEERLALAQQQADQELAVMQQFYNNWQSSLFRKVNADAAVQGSPSAVNYAQQYTMQWQFVTERANAAAALKAEGFGPGQATTDTGEDQYTFQMRILQQAQDAEYQALLRQQNFATYQRNTASNQQDRGFSARFTTAAAAVSGDPGTMNAAALSAFDVQATTELQNLQLSLQQTYGTSYAATQEYANKLTALQKAQGEERLALQKQQALAAQQLAIQSAAQDRGFSTRYGTAAAAISGDPGRINQAALSAFDAQAAADLDNLKLSLRTTYGDAYTTTAAYGAKITALQKAQGEERLALQTQQNHAAIQLQTQATQQAATFAARYNTAVAANLGPRDKDAAALSAFDTQAQAELQNLKLSLTASYGDAYATTADYGNKIAALTKAQGAERQQLVRQQNQAELQLDVANRQQTQAFGTRYSTAAGAVSGDPATIAKAAMDAFNVQAQNEIDNLYVSLTATYGVAYATTQEYADKQTALQKAQGEERLALQVQQNHAAQQLAIQSTAQDRSFSVRYGTAAAAISGDPGRINQAALSAFDVQAAGELDNLKLSLRTTYGDAYTTTAAYGAKITALQKAQGEERLALQVQQAHATTQLQISSQQQNLSFATRYQTAAAQISGGVAAQNAAALAALDAQATAELQNLRLNLTQTYGDAYATTKDYSDKITALTKAQGEERLALQQQQNDALKSQATSVITSLNQYAIGLQTSDKSPYSPQAQLTLARGQFTTQAALAAGGNFAAVQTLQQYSDAYLAAAHTVFGSGVDYVKAFGQVITALATVGAETPDTLTASILQTETRTQTQILVEQLQELQDEVHQLRLQVQQGTAAPARVAVN